MSKKPKKDVIENGTRWQFPLGSGPVPYQPETESQKRRRIGTAYWFVHGRKVKTVRGYDLDDAIQVFRDRFPAVRGKVAIHGTKGFPQPANLIKHITL